MKIKGVAVRVAVASCRVNYIAKTKRQSRGGPPWNFGSEKTEKLGRRSSLIIMSMARDSSTLHTHFQSNSFQLGRSVNLLLTH